MSNQEPAAVSAVAGMAGNKLFADGQGRTMLFEPAGAITLIAQSRSEGIPGTCQFILQVFVGRVFLRQVKGERDGFAKVLHALGFFVRRVQQGGNFLMALGEVALSLSVT